MVAAALLIWATPVELLGLLGALTIFLGIVGGMALQRLLQWLLGWYAETALERAESRREADLKIERVRYYQREGILRESEAERFALWIAREDLFGAAKPRGPRGPYKKRQPYPPAVMPDKPEAGGVVGAHRHAERSEAAEHPLGVFRCQFSEPVSITCKDVHKNSPPESLSVVCSAV